MHVYSDSVILTLFKNSIRSYIFGSGMGSSAQIINTFCPNISLPNVDFVI